MFAKLLKHEFRATGKMMLLLSALALGMGAAGAGVLRFLVYCFSQPKAPEGVILVLLISGTFLMVGMFLSLFAYLIGVEIYLLVRFYRNKFTDEGYLTFTLPASSHQIFASSYVHFIFSSLWASLVFFLSLIILLVFGTATEGLVSWAVLKEIGNGFEEIFFIMRTAWNGSEWLYVINMVVSLFAGPMLVMCAITVGAVVAKKHKVLAAIGVYYGAGMAISAIQGVFSGAALLVELTYYGNYELMLVLPELILQGVTLVGGYFLSTYLMKNKLNLP